MQITLLLDFLLLAGDDQVVPLLGNPKNNLMQGDCL